MHTPLRSWKAAVATLVVMLSCSVLGASRASAQCRACSPFMTCITQPVGARMCLESPGVCSMILPCLHGGGRLPDGGEEEGLLTLSLFDAEGEVSPALETDAGPLAVGEEARGRRGAAHGRLATAMIAFGRDYAVWLADAADRGFAIRRGEAGGAVHVEVLEVAGGVAGRVLGMGLLLAQDRLHVPVTVDGRERVLIVQASVVPRGQWVAAQARLRAELRAAGRALGEPSKPLLEPRAI
jgi:hypothetical protein